VRISTNQEPIRITCDARLAGLHNGDRLTLKEIAARQAISEKYLWQVLIPDLAGLVQARAGSRVAIDYLPPQSITIKDIVFALDGPAHYFCHRVSKTMQDEANMPPNMKFGKNWRRPIVQALTAINLKEHP